MIILVGKTPCKMLIMATFLWLLVYLLISVVNVLFA